jgi:hypothetical protein
MSHLDSKTIGVNNLIGLICTRHLKRADLSAPLCNTYVTAQARASAYAGHSVSVERWLVALQDIALSHGQAKIASKVVTKCGM